MGTTPTGQHTPPGAHAPPLPAIPGRLHSVDLLRGAVMILMALDHARDFYAYTSYDPTDLARADSGLFLTRWVTHFCAPAFFLLAGIGAALSASRGRPRALVARNLVTRGLWLIVLEFTVVRAGWFVGFAADVTFHFAFVQVIWALGWSMIVLAGLVFLPRCLTLAFALALICLHDALDQSNPASFGCPAALWKILHVSAPIEWSLGGSTHTLFVRYPLLPWPGVMALGYVLAPILRFPLHTRTRACLSIGLAMTLLFVLMRAVNRYGDPHPWNVGDSPLLTLLSFINCEKYPPSLCFLLMTLGPAIAALPLLERLPRPLQSPLLTFGAVPMFFYITHLYVLQLGALVAALAVLGLGVFTLDHPPSYGLGAVYAAWILAVLLLYPACRRFARLKHARPAWWRPYL